MHCRPIQYIVLYETCCQSGVTADCVHGVQVPLEDVIHGRFNRGMGSTYGQLECGDRTVLSGE